MAHAQTLSLGADHPDTLISKNGLAVVYKGMKRYEEAEGLLLEVVEARTAKLGVDHPDTLTGKNNLALLYQAQNRYDLAEPLFREVVDGSRRKLGPTHPDTQQRIRNLILCYEQIGQPARAAELRGEPEQVPQGISLGRR